MKKSLFFFLILNACASEAFAVGEADYGDSISSDSVMVNDSNDSAFDSGLDSLEVSPVNETKPSEKYMNCNGDPCQVGGQFCCWFEIVSWRCVSQLDGGACKFPKTCGHTSDCASGSLCCGEGATGTQTCKKECGEGEKEL